MIYTKLHKKLLFFKLFSTYSSFYDEMNKRIVCICMSVIEQRAVTGAHPDAYSKDALPSQFGWLFPLNGHGRHSTINKQTKRSI